MLPMPDILLYFLQPRPPQNKFYPREVDIHDIKVRGRIRIHFRDDFGKPVMPMFPTR